MNMISSENTLLVFLSLCLSFCYGYVFYQFHLHVFPPTLHPLLNPLFFLSFNPFEENQPTVRTSALIVQSQGQRIINLTENPKIYDRSLYISQKL